MGGKPRFVFDTNIIVSAFLFDNSIPQESLQHVIAHGEPLLSADVMDELAIEPHEHFWKSSTEGD